MSSVGGGRNPEQAKELGKATGEDESATMSSARGDRTPEKQAKDAGEGTSKVTTRIGYMVAVIRLYGGRFGLVVRALAFHQCGPGSISALGVKCGLSLLVLYSAMRGFSPGTPVFPSQQKLTFHLI